MSQDVTLCHETDAERHETARGVDVKVTEIATYGYAPQRDKLARELQYQRQRRLESLVHVARETEA